ncbi:MAG: AlpA family phage regulatory protein, partial [Acidobacteria bacterium]
PPAPPPPRGLRMREVCEREGIARSTAWRWVDKGLLQVSRRGPRTGVRVSYPDASGADDDGGELA